MTGPLIPAPDGDYPAPMEEQAAPQASFQLQRLLLFLRRFWWIPLVTLVLGAGAGGAYVYFKEPRFVSKGRMWETVKMRLPEGSLFTEDVQNFLGTQTELLQSETLRQLALARLRSSSSNNVAVPLDEDGKPLPVLVTVRGSSKSSVFLIEATSSRATYAQAYLDALMNVYLEYKKNIRKVVSGDTLASISEQVQRAERDLKNEQDVLTVFQRTNNMAILEEEGRASGGYLARLRTQLSDLQLEARLLSATAANPSGAAGADTNSSLALAVPAAGPDSSSPATAQLEHQAAFKEVELLKMQRDKLSRFLRPKHPKIVKLDSDIERGMHLIGIYQRQGRDQLAASRDNVQMKIENVLLSIKEWESKVIIANSRMAEGERLKQNVIRMQGIYERLAMLVQNVGISRNIDQETLAILEPASPVKRSYTSEISGLGLACVMGLGAGLGIIVLIALRDDRLLSVSEANSKLGDSVVAMLPQIDPAKGETGLTLLGQDDPRHLYAEAYRSLRSALLFLTPESERPKILLVTSATPNEGKSTIAANLARMLALGGSRVLLVDADLRKGHLHSLLELESEPGLIELLRKQCEPQAVIQTNSLPNFYFIARGKFSGNPGDLFLDSALDQILARWRQEFDFVVIDSSPLFAADDASCLAARADGTLFVVRDHHSSARAVREALGMLAQRQARVLGLVYNGADASARSYNYYKYPDYYPAAKAG